MPATADIVASIERRIRDVNDEIERLTRARIALDGLATATPPTARRPRRTTQTRRATPTRRATVRNRKVVAAGKLERLLSEDDGLTTTALARQANADRGHVLTVLRELEGTGRVRRSGQRRGTRWHAITDEDRIQERAAELSARSAKQTSA
jgi:hypothetical protein